MSLRRLICVFVLVGAIPATVTVRGQDPTPAGISEPIIPTEEEIQAELNQLANAPELTEEAIEQIRKKLTGAQRNLTRLAALETTHTQFQQQIKEAAARLDLTRKRLEEVTSQAAKPQTPPPPDESLASLEQELTQREALFQQASQRRKDWEAERQRRETRLKEIPEEVRVARSQLDELRVRLALVNGEQPGMSPLERASWIADRARLPYLQRKIESLQSEMEAYRATAELLQVESDVAVAEQSIAGAAASSWRDLVVLRRQNDAKSMARQAQTAALLASPELSSLAEEVKALAEQRARMTDEIATETQRLTNSQAQLEKLASEFSSVQKRVEAIGLSDASGQILRRDRSAIPDVLPIKRGLEERRKKVEDASFRDYEYQDRRAELVNLEERAQHWADKLSPAPTDEIRRELLNLLKSQRDSLDAVLNDIRKYKEVLLDLNAVQQQLVDTATEYVNFIDERVLWVRSSHPLGIKDARQAFDATRWLAAPHHWRTALMSLASNGRQNLWLAIPIASLLAILAYVQKPARRALGQIGQMVERKGNVHFAPTVRAIGLTAVISALWPCVLCAISWLGWRAEAEFTRALAHGLFWTGLAWFPLEFVRQTCRPQGLAVSHFQWPIATVSVIRRGLRWMNPVGFLLLFVCITLSHVRDSKPLWENSLGRLAFLGLLLLATHFIYLVIRSKSGVIPQVLAHRPTGMWYRIRHLWTAVVFLAPLALVVLSITGYHETASTLGIRLFVTLYLIFLLTIANACFARWILLRRRRLAMEQMKQRRAAEQLEPRAAGEIGSVPLAESTDDVDLAAVTMQTRKLVGIIFLMLGAIGFWLVWNDVIPALTILKKYPVWPGATLTVSDLLKALVAAAITIAATSNVPGLLELTLLNYLPVDRGARYATTSLCRYGVLAFGVIMTARLLDIHWSSVQWLVAAMGIGLGFGLQEIFANFVSGVLLLFERPIRVGDVVTLGETTGVVTKIRIRATTITDWDRKEYIVPNKDLVTGRLLNWTLSDLTNRVVIRVGITIGSDVNKARAILLRIADEHPVILKDPSPSAAFDGFGDGCLNMTLRCCLPNLENRLPTIHDLHAAIHDRFRAEGIDIANPSRELHVHIDGPRETASNSTVRAIANQASNGSCGNAA